MEQKSQGIEKIAELYYRSGSVHFGKFRWTYHQEHPDAEDAPWYLHYPESGTPGTELLPELHYLIGTEFYHRCETNDPPIRPTKIAAIPEGANPLGDAHARHYRDYPRNRILFHKEKLPDDTVVFKGPVGEFEIGDELLIDDDHVSRTRNKRLLIPVARRGGFVVRHVLTVVDHQQGGAERLAEENVTLLSLMTGAYLLEFGFAEGHVTPDQYEEVKKFQVQTRPK